MVCLIKKHYKNELKEYANILGSEEAAYYVLACNNGYTLDRNQNGDPSSLFTALLEENGGDEKAAILSKAQTFTPEFVGQHGEWYETDKEPSIKDTVGYQKCDNSSMESLFPGASQRLDYALEENQTDRTVTVRFIVDDNREKAKQNAVDLLQQQQLDRPVNPREVWQAKRDAAIVFDSFKYKEAIGRCIEELCTLWDLQVEIDEETGEWYVTSKKNDATTNIRIHFLNSLRDTKWTDKKGNTHNGVFMEAGGPEHFMHTILISLEDGNAGTLIHELAHSYVRMFWESQLIQDALRYVTKAGMSQVEIEEALVEKMVEQVALDNVKTSEELQKEYDERGYFAKVRDQYKNIGRDSDHTFTLKEQGEITPKEARKRFWRDFWRNFNDLLRSVVGLPLKYNKNIQQNVLDMISTAFMLKEDISNEKAKELYMEKPSPIMYQTETSKTASKEEKVASSVRKNLQSRLSSEKSQLYRNNALIERLEVWLDKINQRDNADPKDLISTVYDIIQACREDIEKVKQQFANIELFGINIIDPKDFFRLKTDILGFYNSMLNGTLLNYFDKTEIEELKTKSTIGTTINDLGKEILDLSRSFNIYIRKYVDYKLDEFVNENAMVGDREALRENMKKWALNQIDNGDLMPLELWLAPAVVSKSPIIRAVDFMTRTINQEVRQESLKAGHRLVSLYEKAKPLMNGTNPHNFFMHFIELDDKGKPTGFFVRPENYGLMKKQYQAAIDKLLKKHKGVYKDEDGNLQYETREDYISFNDDLDDELEKLHIHRRYTKEYYKTRRKMLSEEAITKLNDLQRQIDILVQKAIDIKTGVPVIGKLKQQEQLHYKQLMQQKANLASIYDVIQDDNGNIISFKKKEGEALRIAEEIQAWHDYLKGRVKYKPNYTKFNQDRQKLVDAYGENSLIVKQFDQSNTTYSLTPYFYKELAKHAPQYFDEDLKKLYQRRRSILNLIKSPGYNSPHLEKLNDEALQELKEIDEQISEIKGNKKGNKFFFDMARMYEVLAYDAVGNLTDKTFHRTIEDKYESLKAIDPIAAEKFINKYQYTDFEGNKKPLSVFYTLGALGLVDPDTGEKYVDNVPTNQYSDIDPESELVDNEYDPSVPEYMQPDKKHHHNKQYDWLEDPKHGAAKQLYDALLKLMQLSYQQLNKFGEGNAYRLPQISDTNARMMFRRGLTGISYASIKKSLSNTFSVTEQDTEYYDDYVKRPDGTEVRTVPIRWVRALEDPSTVSTDLISTVTAFYQMALNYNQKSEFAPLAEMIHYVVNTKEEGVVNPTEQSQRLDKLIDMYIYERRKTGFKGKSLSKSEKLISKSVQNALVRAHGKLMAHNFRSILKNAWDSFVHMWTEAIVGKYFRVPELIKAGYICNKEMLKHPAVLGKANTKNKVAAAMQHTGVSGTVKEIFEEQRSSWLRRVITKHFGMGEYTLVDYTFKGRITVAAYLSVKLIEDPVTKQKRFVNKDEARFIYTQAGLTAKEGYKAWKKSKTTLWKAYGVDEEGNFKLKKEYEDYVRPYIPELNRRSKRIENQVEGVIRERSAVINGMIDEYDRNRLSTHYLGAAFLQMRGWQVTSSWDHLKVGYDFAKYKEFEDQKKLKKGKWYKLFYSKQDVNVEETNPDYKGQMNFATGYIEYGNWQGLWKLMKKTLRSLFGIIRNERFAKTLEERRQIRRLECALVGQFITGLAVYYLGLWAMGAAGDGDDDDFEARISRFLYTVSVAATSERAADIPILNVVSFLDLIKTPMVASTLIQDFEALPSLAGDIISGDLFTYLGYKLGWSDDASAYNDLEVVERGSYKNRTKVERDLLKSSSYLIPEFSPNNFIKSFDKHSNAQTENFYRQIIPANFAPKAQFKDGNAGYKKRYFWEFWASEEDNVEEKSKKKKKSKKKSKSPWV